MQAFRRSGDHVEAQFEDIEVSVLTNLTEQLRSLIDGVAAGAAVDDAAGERLFPAAYTDDDEAAAEFRRFTVDELAQSKKADADAVLTTFREHGALPVQMGRTAVVRIDRELALQWMRSLTDLRLSLDSRIAEPTEELVAELSDDDVESLRGMYDWLTFVQGTLIEAVEELDAL
ncbi:DUF2017 family protein [Paramicrobacterium agarici]|uniref:Uncharacterized protein DUF2017 n=1 Tax=Paramicrobacterium agarici TaxID=630514 RepID=A0A2A9DWA6_9MICO|nr:DUF2017 family protein [Microbacterium agarici]PFG30282.1 uncharacterized protein DUF2017 [Microbacterium agarici]TQO23289.1 uncharacterized protein DUF2017 [Microbacterium agarici]